MIELKRRENENEEQFIWRIGQLKESGEIDLDWDNIADIVNKEFREDESLYRSESAYRKPFQNAKRYYEAGVFNDYTDDSYITELREVKHEIRKEKQKLFDERTALNKVLREQGRIESMYDVVARAIEEYQPTKFNYTPTIVNDSDNDLIIHLTDVHCGVDFVSRFNTFNFQVLKHRLQNYLNEIYEIKDTYNAQNAYVILGGDMIQGLIHVNSRIEAKENVIEQIMKVSDLVGNFIYELSIMFQNVEVHTTAGNHSRVTENKEHSVHRENFDLLIPFICKRSLKRR